MPASPVRRPGIESRSPERPSFAARLQVIGHFQALVAAGAASWELDAGGRLELHLAGGEVFLLLAAGIRRTR